MNLEFFREIHEKEFRQKDAMAQRANAIVAVLTTLIGVLGFVAVNYSSEDKRIDYAFWLFFTASMITLIVAVFYLIKSYFVSTLNDIAKPSEWIVYWQELQVKYGKKQGNFSSAEEEFADHLVHLYADVADKNIDSNFMRGNRLVRSNNAALIAFPLLMATLLLFYINNYVLSTKGDIKMVPLESTFFCVPASQQLGPQEGPGTRPVPNPQPDPGPPRD